MKIEKFCTIKDGQMAQLNKARWSVARLIELSRDFEVFSIPLKGLNVYYTYADLSLREMVTHIEAVNNADLKYPIILDEDGELLDGRHSIMKAMLNRDESINAVRFDENPSPCEVKD